MTLTAVPIGSQTASIGVQAISISDKLKKKITATLTPSTGISLSNGTAILSAAGSTATPTVLSSSSSQPQTTTSTNTTTTPASSGTTTIMQDSSAATTTGSIDTPATTAATPVYKKVWFWVAIAAAAVGLYFGYKYLIKK